VGAIVIAALNLCVVIACDKREAFAQGANGSRERAPDDRLRDEAIHTLCATMDCFARNDG
jgi:hypothetical protein